MGCQGPTPRDYLPSGCAAIIQIGAQPVVIEGLVADQRLKIEAGDQRFDTDAVMPLAGQKDEANEIAEGIEGLCHNSEAVDAEGKPLKLEPGLEHGFKIIKMNPEEKKVGLSIKAISRVKMIRLLIG